jgi:hypothetical protein
MRDEMIWMEGGKQRKPAGRATARATMGKKQHSKDQLYLTPTEWQADWGGKKHALHLPWKTLPYNCCAISFRPFEVPMCAKDGSCFDLCNIVPYIKKFKRHPVTGDPLAAGDLTKLKFQKNAEGNHHCPVLFKIFNNHTHIVAIRTSGHVYCHEAVKELNLKAKCMRDLIDDTPFTRDDIITLQVRARLTQSQALAPTLKLALTLTLALTLNLALALTRPLPRCRTRATGRGES